MIGFLLFILWL